MKRIDFTNRLFEVPELRVRNQRDDLIRQIVEKTDAPDKKKFARRLAVVANQLHWSNTDLHALLQKHGQVRNFSKFVNWSLKTHRVDSPR